MGGSQSSEKLEDFVISEISDYSSHGFIDYHFVGGKHAYLAYRHPKFNLLVKRLQKDQAYRLSYTINVDNCFGDNKRTWIRDVFDVPVIKISGTIVDYIPDRSNEEEKEDPYVEVILEQRPLIIPGYEYYYAVLLIEKERIASLKTGVPYEFNVSLFRGENEFLIKDISCSK